jgi:fatty-acyl-CoA synthase
MWLDLITKNGGTISYSPTFGYELCARRAEAASIEHLDLSRWRSAGLGGDMIRTGPLRAFADRFKAVGFSDTAFVASYGMAEATLALSMSPLGEGLKVETLDVERLERDNLAVVTTDADRGPATSPATARSCRVTNWKSATPTARSCRNAALAGSMRAAPA